MNWKRLIWCAKVALMVAIIWAVANQIGAKWGEIRQTTLAINLLPGPLAVLAFSGVMLTSASVWLWLTRQMGDRGPRLPLLGAYTYSQMGKYVIGKVVLLLMRLERSGRFGMSPQTCTLATLLENALYMISGALVGMMALVWHAQHLYAEGHGWILPASAVITIGLLACCHPRIFYGLVNMALSRMKKPRIAPDQQLNRGHLLLSVLMFAPCWIFGGCALWISAYCVSDLIPLSALPVFIGGFALSVISGMISFLPGGLGPREAVLGLFVTWEMYPLVGNKAIAIGAVVACLQRLFQIGAEVLLGITGAILSAKGKQVSKLAQSPQP